jgi:hypothetical protein
MNTYKSYKHVIDHLPIILNIVECKNELEPVMICMQQILVWAAVITYINFIYVMQFGSFTLRFYKGDNDVYIIYLHKLKKLHRHVYMHVVAYTKFGVF